MERGEAWGQEQGGHALNPAPGWRESCLATVAMLNPMEIMPVLALAAMLVFIPLMSDSPP
jgi:hypothetical protein